jgi:hypothetical protein
MMQWILAAAASPVVFLVGRAVATAVVTHYTGRFLRRREERRG